MFTYRATNTLNGKFYIGSSTNFESRRNQHLSDRRRNTPFHNALRKYPEMFEWEVWEDDSDEPILEQALLDMFFGTEQCYNLNPLASRPPSQKGATRTPEQRKRVSDAKRGRKNSPEHCKNISAGKRGKPGRKWTQKQKDHMTKLKEKERLPQEEIDRRIDIIQKSGIDVFKHGSRTKISKLLGLSRTQTNRFLNKYYFNQ